MGKLLWIGLGGVLGAISRYLLSSYVQEASKSFNFPYGTLAVNVLGCAAIGVLSYLFEVKGAFSPELRVFLTTGILGAFTTFSSFSLETIALLRAQQFGLALANLAANNGLGLAAVWLGRSLAGLLG
jgi:CrcB protein